MTIEELRALCEEAARDLIQQGQRPVPPTVVLPGPERTRLVSLPDFPDDDEARHDLMVAFTGDEMLDQQIPCWGFVAEAEVEGADAVVVAYGARRHAPQVAAAPVGDAELGDFGVPEDLDPTALPFLHPLQHAVDSLEPEEGPAGGDDGDLPVWPG